MNHLDLFSGIGGFHKGFIDAGFKFDYTGYSEIYRQAKEVYNKHFSESEDLGDVRTIKVDRLPKINLITFGFPCQDLSIAGKRGGLSASRSGLFFEAMRIIRDAKPDYFIFENVKGLFSSNGGLDWFNVLREIADSGYDGQWQLLNTRWFLPQNRERIYFVGHIRGDHRPQVFPIEKSNNWDTEEISGKCIMQGRNKNTSGCLDTRGVNAYDRADLDKIIFCYDDGASKKFQSGMFECSPALKATRSNYRLQEVKPLRWARTEKGRKIRQELKSMGKDYTPFSEGCRELIETNEDVSGCITNALNKDALLSDKSKVRCLTPLECERLQGFPDNWTAGHSDSARYKMLGNAVSVPVVKAIGERLIEDMKGAI